MILRSKSIKLIVLALAILLQCILCSCAKEAVCSNAISPPYFEISIRYSRDRWSAYKTVTPDRMICGAHHSIKNKGLWITRSETEISIEDANKILSLVKSIGRMKLTSHKRPSQEGCSIDIKLSRNSKSITHYSIARYTDQKNKFSIDELEQLWDILIKYRKAGFW